MMLRVAVIGAGGREDALRWVLGRTASVLSEEQADDADLVVIGPEGPLVAGEADRRRGSGQLVFGPGADGAWLEGSKAWMKEVLAAAGVPTARSAAFAPGEADAAVAFLATLHGLYVVKTDYLAAGKGVLVTGSLAEAASDVRAKLARGAVVIEEGLTGPELSVLAVCNGKDFVLLPASRDHKRVGDGDTGPNTGGMGAFSPVTGAEALDMEEVVGSTLAELVRRGIDYRGVLYAGLMLTPDGPKVLEYNVRFGDPEAQVVLPRLVANFPELLLASLEGNLSHYQVAWAEGACVGVVLASAGYPGPVETGRPISGLADAAGLPQVQVFHAGTVARDGRVVTAGGRVLTVTALGKNHGEARTRAYEACSRINFDGMAYRKDIAADAMEGAA